MNYFIDTNICIYFLKGTFPAIIERIKSLQPGNIKIPSIVKAELLYGAEKSIHKESNKTKIYQFLRPFEIISFDDKASVFYGQIRASLEVQGNIIGPNDIILAATVLCHNGILVTNNEKELKRVDKLMIENWIE